MGDISIRIYEDKSKNSAILTIYTSEERSQLVGLINSYLDREMGPFSRSIERIVHDKFDNQVYVSLTSPIGIDISYLKNLMKKCKKYIKNVGKQ